MVRRLHGSRLALVVCLAAILSADAVAAAPRTPNFLFIYTDDQRWDALGVVQREQGERGRFPWLETPSLDRLAAAGVRFRNAFVVNSLCSPSRATLLTGQYSHANGVVNNQEPHPPGNLSLPALLRPAGYVSAYIGKWHHGRESGKRPGFDFSASFVGQGEYFDCPFEVDGVATPTTGFVDDVATDYAARFIRDHRADPFLLILGFKTCHKPFLPPPRRERDYEGERARRTPNLDVRPTYKAAGSGPVTGPPPAGDAAGVPTNLGMFRGISAIDDNVGRLLDLLDELGLADDTVVCFSSDNGFYLGEHGLGDKRSAYDEALRVPLLVRYPRLVAAGRTEDRMVLNVDVAPTFLDLAGVPVPAAMHGRSWRPLLAGDRAAPWRESFFYCYFYERNFATPTTTALRTADAKLIVYPGHDDWTEVFDLAADPYETRNLAADPAHAGLRKSLEAAYEEQSRAIGFHVPASVHTPPVDGVMPDGVKLTPPQQPRRGAAPAILAPPSAAGSEAAAEPLRDLDSHCPFTPPPDRAAWLRRAANLRDQLRVACGLWPMPTLEPLRPLVRGKITLDGYAVERVSFESLPGLFVTGNLYRPDPPRPGRRLPAVLCPHGHWPDGRFQDVPKAEILGQLASGAEAFASAARNPIQARCVQLARMGCVVFQWDMLGYCDSVQISLDRAHRFASQPADTEVTDDGWLLYSPQAESHAQSVLGLQTLATLRSVDFVLTLPEVDPERVGITGASGGGTQSFIAAAIDPRIAAAFPAVMVSTGMQGGCTCENACGLRIGTGNVELAALIAPRPLGLTAADDWTRTMPEDGFPELVRVFELLGAGDRTTLHAALQFGHNYNHDARTAMYAWINRNFALGLDEPVRERDFRWLGRDDLTVWDADHPAPPGGPEFERRLLRRFRDDVTAQLERLIAAGDGNEFRRVVGTGWKSVFGLTAVAIEPATAVEAGGTVTFTSPSEGGWSARLVDAEAEADPAAVTIACPARPGQPARRYALSLSGQAWREGGVLASDASQPLVANPRLAAAYTYGYNLPLAARRARQVAATLAWLHAREPDAVLTVSGRGEAAGLAAGGCFCRTSAEPEVAARLDLCIDPAGFRFGAAASIRAAGFLPAAARYLDLPGLVGCLPLATAVQGDDSADFERFTRLTAARGLPAGAAQDAGQAVRSRHPAARRWLAAARAGMDGDDVIPAMHRSAEEPAASEDRLRRLPGLRETRRRP